jgi:8-oxo-dGTP pyrophosphatase MutT (NUDIX family)
MLGRILFYLLWPLIWIYAPLTRRVRGVIIHNGKILVVKNWLGPGLWQLPGGGTKIGETVAVAIKRELEEELCLKVASITKMHKEPIIVKQFGLMMRYNFVLVKPLKENSDLIISKSILKVGWLNIEDLTNVSTEVKTGLDLVLKRGASDIIKSRLDQA